MATLEDRLTLAAWNAAMEGRGNTKLIWGEYTGDGQYGANHPVTLTFDGKPLWVRVRPATQDAITASADFLWGETALGIRLLGSNNSATVHLAWTDNSLSWWHDSNAASQWSQANVPFLYYALLGV